MKKIILASLPSYLPIVERKDEIISKIKKHKVVIIEGETGSGKSTQIPKLALLANRGIYGKIACTQPRRIAAVSIADRITEEINQGFGDYGIVGYKIRFKEEMPEYSLIKVVTDGMLLSEVQKDPLLKEYDTVIVDEAHERNLNIDLVLGVLRRLTNIRRDLKLIITSATIDTQKFSRAFNNAPVISVSGRIYPIQVSYLSKNKEHMHYTETALSSIKEICSSSKRGDILVFMPTEFDVHLVCRKISKTNWNSFVILPLFARLGIREQKKVFVKTKKRKIIVATNIAETSITVPGIKYVVDSGFARISKYQPNSRITVLPVVPISQSSADQRKGRCGRVEGGMCIRLYSKADYLSRPVFSQPEILKANLSQVILRMIAFNLGDIASFPLIDRPLERNFIDGLKLLSELGAIIFKKRRGDEGNKKLKINNYRLTYIGKIMAELPLDPRLSRVIIEAVKEDCLKEALIVVSALNLSDPMERPIGMEKKADLAHAFFKNNSSDFVTFLNIWSAIYGCKNSNFRRIKKMCKQYFLSLIRILEWKNIHDQIENLIGDHEYFQIKFKVNKSKKNGMALFSPLYSALHRAILSGFLSNIAVRKDKYLFTAQKSREVMLFPGSGLYGGSSFKWIVSAEFVRTSKLFARCNAIINADWLEKIGGSLCKYSWRYPRWDEIKREVIAREQVSLFGLVIKDSRFIVYGRVKPSESTDIFVREALVNGNVSDTLPFINSNKKVIKIVKEKENRIRKRNIFIGDDELFKFYRERLDGIFNFEMLKQFIEKGNNENSLYLTETDISNYSPSAKELQLFPKVVDLDGGVFKCSYFFDPGSSQDGLTVYIPLNSVHNIRKEKVSWLIPGLLKEKVTFLIRGLNKCYRRKLMPISEVVNMAIRKMSYRGEDLCTSLSRFIFKNLNVKIPISAWPINNLPMYLMMRIVVRNSFGKIVLDTREETSLSEFSYDSLDIDCPDLIKKRWELEAIKGCDFGNLPERLTYFRKNKDYVCYPRLKLEDSGLNVRLFNDLKVANRMHRQGISTLFSKYLRNDLKYLKKNIKFFLKVKDENKYFGGLAMIRTQIYAKIIDDFFSLNILTFSDFKRHASTLKNKVFEEAENRCKAVSNLIESFYQVYRLISKIEINYSNNGFFHNFSENMMGELLRLVPKNFIKLYNFVKIKDLIRYINAIDIRIRRCIENPDRDKKRSEMVSPYVFFSKKLDNDKLSIEKQALVEKYLWMIEEYKVSVFAQEVKTSFPVSSKKLDEAIKEIKKLF